MATLQSFEELTVWQKSRIFCQQIYMLTANGNFQKDFALIDQLNRSCGSIMDNIAEGFGRMGNREFINYLTYSYASALESKSQLYRAIDRNYIGKDKSAELFSLIEEIKMMINALISYLRTSPIRGRKFN